VKELHGAGNIHGIISIGGSGGTSLSSAVMRSALPIGFPKLIVSTMASGDVSSFIRETDITMMYSVVDVAGRNFILDNVFRNAAAAIGGMTTTYFKRSEDVKDEKNRNKDRPRTIAITMFGVTTRGVDFARKHIASFEPLHNGRVPFEILTFHATGAGGRAMERLIMEGRIDGVLDLTTTELADELVGGVLSAGPDRLTAASKRGIPQIIAMGGCDMVNFGPRDTVPSKFRDRLLYEHNPDVTLMRTNEEECKKIGLQVAKKLKKYAIRPDRVEVWLPYGGMSELSGSEGNVEGPFYDESADDAIFDVLKEKLNVHECGILVVESAGAGGINGEQFAVDAADRLLELMKQCEIERSNYELEDLSLA